MNARRTLGLLILSTSTVALAGAGSAVGQEPDPNVPITQRPRPAYDPLGIRAGSFLVFPSLTVSENYDDNVFATPDDEESDFITTLSPRVDVGSNFSRHSLGFSVGSDVAFHLEEEDEDYQDVFGNINGRLDITRANNLSLNLNAGRFHEGRDDPEDVGADELNTFLRYGGALTYFHTFNRLNFRLREIVTREEFSDIDGISQDARDETVYDSRLRVGFFVSPRFNLFTEGRYIIRDRDEDEPINRDSQGWEARLGTEIDITAVLFGEAFVGFRQETFDDDDRFGDESGISFGTDLTWNPTTLTTVTLGGGADFDSTTNVDDEASSNFETNVALAVDHELLRNVLIGANVGFARDDFEGIDRTDNTLSAGAGVTYLLNRYLSLSGDYSFQDRSSDVDAEEFTRNRFTLSITAQL